MALFRPQDLRQFAEDYRLADWNRFSKSTETMLSEAAAAQKTQTRFDIFLSHSAQDAAVIVGIYALFKKQSLDVYVDWIVDPQLDRAAVTSRTAEQVRGRMRQSKALIYAHSLNSGKSRWMPWELGYFDGFRSAVAILPISETGQGTIAGVEYLSLYPYIDVSGTSIYINRGAAPDRLFGPTPVSGYSFKSFREWFTERGI